MTSICTVFLVFLQAFGSQDTSNVVVDAFPDVPFLIKKPNVIVPDSLGGKDLVGTILVQMRLDSCGKILGHKILTLIATDRSGKTKPIEYRLSHVPNENVKRFEKWIEAYLDKLIITRKPSFDTRYKMKSYLIGLPIKIGRQKK